MNKWSNRPPEIAHLLNPAFCSILIRDMAAGMVKEDRPGLPLSYTFLCIPIVLHRHTRESLPTKISSKMHTWLVSNQEVTIGFSQRAKSLVPLVKESIIWGISGELFTIIDNSLIVPTQKRIRYPKWSKDSEVKECQNRSIFLGRWLAYAGPESTVYTLWGVCP